jgi:hypothetical protein
VIAHGLSAPKQLYELLNSEAGVGDDTTERAGPKVFVIGNDDPCVRLLATQHHVATSLSTKNEPDALQRCEDFSARQVGRELGHVTRPRVCLRGLHFDEFLARFGWNRITGFAAVLNVKRDRFPDVA